MYSLAEEIRKRKSDHIRICLKHDVGARGVSTWLEHVWLVHSAIPAADYDAIDMRVRFLGHDFSAPIMVSAMTGGTEEAGSINAAIAEAVEELGLGMGVGSQRAALKNPDVAKTFRIARERAPSAFIVANIGYSEIARGLPLRALEELVAMIEADALAIHLNPLQEVVQAEGKPGGRGFLDKLAEITSALPVPVIVKEVGSGISAGVAKALEMRGVRAVDVAGAGGTSWAAVEHYRALEEGDALRARLGRTFWDWGIPTAASILEVAFSTRMAIIASGGVRTGLDVAKCLALGAHMAAMALPVLKEAVKGTDAVKALLSCVMEELRAALFVTGCKRVNDLKAAPIVLTGPLAEWARARGLAIEGLARRLGGP